MQCIGRGRHLQPVVLSPENLMCFMLVYIHQLKPRDFQWNKNFLALGKLPPLCYHRRLAAICSPNTSCLCSFLPGIPQLQKGWELPPLVKQAITSALFQAKKADGPRLIPFSSLGNCFICSAVLQKVGRISRQKARLLKLCVFAGIQNQAGALHTGSQPLF